MEATNYAKTDGRSVRRLSMPTWIRYATAVGITFSGFCFFASLTTSTWCLTPDWWRQSFHFVTVVSAIAAVVMAPLSWIPFVGCRWRTVVAGMFLLPFLSVTSAEVFGRAQELLLVRQHGERPSHAFTVDRWPPFEHHSLGYGQNCGWWGCD